jgi:Cft2 family RNA processing exonuclease
MPSLTLTNLTGAIEIGANCYLLEIDGHRIVLDSGAHPKRSGLDVLPQLGTLPDGSIDTIFLSHAHQDHIGTLPVLMRHQERAKVFMTDATKRLGETMLHNSVNVMLKEKEAGVEGYPLYTHRGVDMAVRRWQTRPLRQLFDLTGERVGRPGPDDITFEFHDAGHIMGSVGTLIRAKGKTIFSPATCNLMTRRSAVPRGFRTSPKRNWTCS